MLLAAGAAVIANLGMVLQARSHRVEAQRSLASQRHFTRQPLWWAGMLLVVLGAIGDFVALTLAPATLVAALGCLNLVAQAVWAPLLLSEDITRHYAPLALILVGVVLAVVFGPHASLNFSIEVLFARFQAVGFAVYVAAVVVIVAVLAALLGYVEARFRPPPRPLLSDYVDVVRSGGGGSGGSATEATIPTAASGSGGAPSLVTAAPVVRHGWARFHRVGYAVTAGVIGAQVSHRPAVVTTLSRCTTCTVWCNVWAVGSVALRGAAACGAVCVWG